MTDEQQPEPSEPTATINWKDSLACIGLTCTCGYRSHADGWFSFAMQCPRCGVVWELPTVLSPMRVESPADSDLVVETDDIYGRLQPPDGSDDMAQPWRVIRERREIALRLARADPEPPEWARES
jgi:hypothetical protein